MALLLSNINKFVSSRSMVAVAGILMLVAARVAFQMDEITYFTTDRGPVFQSPNLWIDDTWLTMVVNTALILCAALGWLLVIQIFNPFRAMTALPASFFLIMMLSVPDLTDQLYGGTLLACVIPACLTLLWSSFANGARLRHIFLLFVLLSAMTMTQYCFAVYIPVFIIGCAQMKIMSLRTLVAIVLGLVTPWWIVLGLGIVDVSSIHSPEFANFFSRINIDGTVNIVLVGCTTGALLVIGWIGNFMNVLTLNVNLRAFNGSISLISIFTLIAICADFTNAAAYLPTLMLMASYQLSFLLGRSTTERRFIPILIIMGAYVAFYVMRILI